MRYIIANWKAHKTLKEAQAWADRFLEHKLDNDQLKIIIAAPFPFLVGLSQQLSSQKNITLASQDVSAFDEGAYTGEVTAKMLQGIVSYVVIGHSERKTYNNENDETVKKKVKQAVQQGLIPILCIQNERNVIPQEVTFVAYEPVESIGTGNNASSSDVIAMKKKLSLSANTKYLYGGSVNADNISQYVSSSEIDGCLVATHSLDPDDFFNLLTKI